VTLPISTTRVFNNGNSQAVRIPAEFLLSTDQVQISRTKNGDLIHPIPTERGQALLQALQALVPGGAGRTLPTGEVAAQRFESYMLENFYSGCYIGSVADVADFGQLVMQVFADGRVAGKLPTSRNSPAPSRFNGMFRGNGKFQASLEESAGTISGSVVPLVNQAVGVVEFMTTERTRQGGVLSRNPQAFPSFDTTPCREFVEESLQP